MKKVCSMLLALLLVFSLFACGKKGPDLPVYKNIAYEQADENTYLIPGITGADFDGYLQLLRENGFTFTPSDALPSEEEAVAMNLWQGGNGELEITIFLMLSFAGDQPSQYLKIYISD